VKAFLSASVAVATSAFAGGLEVRPVSCGGPDIVLPYVVGGKWDVAEKINHSVFAEGLGSTAPSRYHKTFQPQDTEALGHQSNLNFQVGLNNGRALSITLFGEGCGAYCQGFSTPLLFDARTGRRVELDQVFQTEGIALVQGRMDSLRASLYRDQVSSLRETLADPQRRATVDTADLEDRLALDLECPEKAASSRYEFGSDSLTVVAEQCANHARQALDDVGEVAFSVSYRELRPLMTKFGRSILSQPSGRISR
jgi:hypothetical protein